MKKRGRTNSAMRRLLLVPLAGLVLLPTAGAHAAVLKLKCNKTHGVELAHSSIVKVYKVKVAKSSKFEYVGCAKPSGPVVTLTHPFTQNKVKMVAHLGAYVAFTRTIEDTDTISVVDARTGRQKQAIFAPDNIDFDVDPDTPEVAAVTLNLKGEAAVVYAGLASGGTTGSNNYVYAYDGSRRGRAVPRLRLELDAARQLAEAQRGDGHLDARRQEALGHDRRGQPRGHSRQGELVGQRHDGAQRRHRLPRRADGAVWHVRRLVRAEHRSHGHATGSATSTVTITGGCSAVHAPVAGQTSSVATCTVRLNSPKRVTVTFS